MEPTVPTTSDSGAAPRASDPAAEPTTEAIEALLNEIRPAIQMDGGDIELVAVLPKEGEVHVRMQGACVGCMASSYTLKLGVEQLIQEKYPNLEVIQVG